jgi:hypothetical protein
MNLYLHRYAVAFAKCLLPVISLILLTAQLTYQPICFHSPAKDAATLMQQPRGGGPGDLPASRCHGKVLLSLDKRYDLKPVLFLPAPLFRLAVMDAPMTASADYFSSAIAAGKVRAHCYRGPPSC